MLRCMRLGGNNFYEKYSKVSTSSSRAPCKIRVTHKNKSHPSPSPPQARFELYNLCALANSSKNSSISRPFPSAISFSACLSSRASRLDANCSANFLTSTRTAVGLPFFVSRIGRRVVCTCFKSWFDFFSNQQQAEYLLQEFPYFMSSNFYRESNFQKIRHLLLTDKLFLLGNFPIHCSFLVNS